MVKSTFKLIFKAVSGVSLIVSKIFVVFVIIFSVIAAIFEVIEKFFVIIAKVLTLIEESSFDSREFFKKFRDWIMPIDNFEDDDTPPNNGKPNGIKIYKFPKIKTDCVSKIVDEN